MTAGKRSAGKKRLGPLSAEEFDAANRAFFRLYQSSNLLHKVGTRSVSSLGTTTQQWAVIGALARPADRDMGLTVKALMELLTVSRQTITPLLDRLEQRGWLERVRNGADGRSRRVHLTALGSDIWSRMQTLIAGFYAEALRDFSAEEEQSLYQLLDKLKTSLSRMQDDD